MSAGRCKYMMTMANNHSEFPILEKILSAEIGYFMSMSDVKLERHVAGSRIKQRVAKRSVH